MTGPRTKTVYYVGRLGAPWIDQLNKGVKRGEPVKVPMIVAEQLLKSPHWTDKPPQAEKPEPKPASGGDE